MGNVIGDILPLAIGVAISPVPIIAVILMLFTPRAKANGVAFLIGWVGGLAIAGGVVLALANADKISAGGTPSPSPTTRRIFCISESLLGLRNKSRTLSGSDLVTFTIRSFLNLEITPAACSPVSRASVSL